MERYFMTIGGARVDSPENFEVVNPSTGRPFASVPAASAAHLDAAVAAARSAFPGWSATPVAERQRLIHELGAVLERNMPELMAIVTRESGKPMKGLNGVGSGMELGGAIAWTHAAADFELPVDVIQDDAIARVEVHRKPLGVVASITPWNWPLMIAIWHVMPALRTGNAVVIKPAALTPAATLRFVELANAVLPPGVLNAISATHEAGIGDAIARHPGIDKIVFTGSTPTGRRIMQSAAGNLKRLTLELGGNDAGIVLPDVSPKTVAPRLFGAAFHNNGQTCACLKRLYVHESIYDDVCKELAQLACQMTLGDGMLPETMLGPVQNAKQRAYVDELVADACRQGGRVLAGGENGSGAGYFYRPTVIADVTDGMRVVDEEQFGPVLPVVKYADIEDAIRRANDNPNGLGGSIWSSDLALASALGQRLECGTVWVNEHGALQPNAPFGGVKQSGLGVEFGTYGLEEYTTLQTLKVMKS